jgi:hypothetical protein
MKITLSTDSWHYWLYTGWFSEDLPDSMLWYILAVAISCFIYVMLSPILIGWLIYDCINSLLPKLEWKDTRPSRSTYTFGKSYDYVDLRSATFYGAKERINLVQDAIEEKLST